MIVTKNDKQPRRERASEWNNSIDKQIGRSRDRGAEMRTEEKEGRKITGNIGPKVGWRK